MPAQAQQDEVDAVFRELFEDEQDFSSADGQATSSQSDVQQSRTVAEQVHRISGTSTGTSTPIDPATPRLPVGPASPVHGATSVQGSLVNSLQQVQLQRNQDDRMETDFISAPNSPAAPQI
jgi:hypothetical protein